MEYLTAYVLIGIFAVLILLAVTSYKSKYVIILLLLFMWSLCIFCTEAYDLRNMEYVYNYYPQVTEEHAPGYDIFLKTCIELGLSFNAFKAIVGAFSLALTYLAIKKSTDYFALVLGFYAIYPFFGTVTQIRNGMMAAIVMYFLVGFIADPRHSIWKYVFGIFLASMFHYAAVIYLIFILARRRINTKILFIIVISMVIIINVIIQNNLLYNVVTHFISNPRVLQWFDFQAILAWSIPENNNWKSQALLVFIQTAGYVLFYMVLRNYKRCLQQQISSATMQQGHYFNTATLDFANRIELLMFCILPLYILTPTFFRIYYDVVLLIYIITAQYLSISRKSGYRIITARRLCLGVLLYGFFTLLTISYMQGGLMEMLNSYSLVGQL